ncbi:MAG: MoxR family ATPase [Treponema sp.]|nr:MoxR family ATPase [Treponema sp.]
MSMINDVSQKIIKEVKNVYKTKSEIIEMILASLFAGGHVLLEDVPGTGKTILAKAVSKATGLDFSRIQCTPDLMPQDVTGSSIWRPDQMKFEFRKGPVMSSVVLVDELNRATPRTQSALLECMAENQISVDGNSYILEKPFFVIATENPVESEGTFPLPEAQKDRFMFCLNMGYPDDEDEKSIITAQRAQVHPVENVKTVVTKEQILECIKDALQIYVDDSVLEYILALVKKTREDERINSGISPRGSIALYKAAQAYAAVKGKNFVSPEDVKKLAVPVFRKRLILTTDSLLKGYSSEEIISEFLDEIPIPVFNSHV